MRQLLTLTFITIYFYLSAGLPAVKPGYFSADVDYEVWYPGSEDPVEYSVSLLQQPSATDTIFPANFLIISELRTRQVCDTSFSAWFDGNFFRFKADRMTEYHLSDSVPFDKDIVLNDNLSSLLPAFINRSFREMEADSAYSFAVTEEKEGIKVKGSESRMGYTVRNFEYIVSNDSLPVSLEITNNPGEISETVFSAKYSYPSEPTAAPLSEEYLMNLFPDEFRLFRPGSFSAASLVGRFLPSFSLSIDGRNRLEHNRADGFLSPTLFVVLDKYSPEIISKVRETTKEDSINIVYAFIKKRSDYPEEIELPRPNETYAFGASSFARNAGIDRYPTLLFCNTDGIIENISFFENNCLLNFVNISEN